MLAMERRRSSVALAFAVGLKHHLGHFLPQQRDAVGALDDVLSDILWQRFVARYAVDHRGDFALAEAIEGESGDVGPTDPRQLKLRSMVTISNTPSVFSRSTVRPTASSAVR